jgi:hypothetical protein
MCALLVFSTCALAATVTIRPDSQGNYAAWSATGCTAANGWQCVDEAVANTSDRVYSGSNSVKESFGFQNVSLTSETINSVTLYYYAYRYGTSKYKMQPMIRSGTTDYLGGVKNLTASYAYYSQTYTTNPATGAAWTVSEVNSLQAGMSTYSSNGGAYAAQVYALVDYTPLPDLVISSVGFSNPYPFVGDVVTVYVTTKNNGPGSAGASATLVNYSETREINVSTLSNGSYQADSFNYTCNVNTTFTATADYNGAVTETNETNNKRTNTLICKEKPDLVINNMSFYEWVQEVNGTNQTYVNVTTEVKNIGLESSGNFTTKTTYLPSFKYWYTGYLAPSSSVWFSQVYLCYAAHNYTASADYYGQINEADESNNQLATYIDCVV